MKYEMEITTFFYNNSYS